MEIPSILLGMTILVLACCPCSFAVCKWNDSLSSDYGHRLQLFKDKKVGICYGLNGNDLPPPNQVVQLYQRCGVRIMRLFEPRADILQAVSGSGICLILGTRNEDLQRLGTSQAEANQWVNQYVAPYKKTCFFAITLGNEAIPGQYASFIPQAMINMRNALTAIGRGSAIVSTVLPATTLEVSYPPSAGKFTPEVAGILQQVARAATHLRSPIMINVYPYFAYTSNPADVSLDYALFNSTRTVVIDESYQYDNLFDAIVDAFHAAFEKVGHPETVLYVSETGWPSAGNEPYTSPANARAYNGNLLKHVSAGRGTPRRPGKPVGAILFALFNENLKPAGVEQHFGLFYPDLKPVYPFC